MSFDLPDISIIIRTKNSEKTIKKCLDSILEQNASNFEIIIIDSGSKDMTKSIVSDYSHKWIQYPENKQFNYAHALNIGIAQSTKKYVLIMSSHVDFLFRDTIKWMHYFLKKDLLCKAVSLARSEKHTSRYSLLTFKDIKWKIINEHSFKGQGMYNYCAMTRRSDLLEMPFDEDFPTCEDQAWIYKQMKLNNANAVIIENPYVHYINPYYNLRKDINEHLIIAKFIHPYLGSYLFLKKKFISSLKSLFKLKFASATHQFLLGIAILLSKFLPINPKKFSSVYNKKLN